MAKYITLKLTEIQFRVIIDMANTLSSMMGEGEGFSFEQDRNIKIFDRMLKKHGYKRKLN